jgi:propanol-preferring alcohol dehydrogenase
MRFCFAAGRLTRKLGDVSQMHAMLLDHLAPIQVGSMPLRFAEVNLPSITEDEVLLQVQACGVCHTELDEIEGRTPPPRLPVILGHQVVGRVMAVGENVHQWRNGDRVGAAWIFGTCGECQFCLSGRENLCPQFRATGRDRDGGYAEYMAAPAAFLFRIPDVFSDVEAAPLLCAGAIGYRSLRLTNLLDGQALGLTGFGASARIVLALAKARFPGTKVFVFARSEREREAALELGAVWSGDSFQHSPVQLDAIVDTTPAWSPVVAALENLAPGGRLVINAIRKEQADQSVLASLDYERHVWLEKEIKSVANVTRRDVSEFLELAATMHLEPQVEEYPLAAANTALIDLKTRPITASKVLRIGS